MADEQELDAAPSLRFQGAVVIVSVVTIVILGFWFLVNLLLWGRA